MPSRPDLERAFSRLADSLGEYVAARAERALRLERDRAEAETAELREEVAGLGLRLSQLERELRALSSPGPHSVHVRHLTEEER